MKTKGFTLIELLAVIVILAIIALIATPIVLNIIKDSKESATLQSAEFYLGAVENAVAQKIMDEPAFRPTSCDIQADGNLKCGDIEVVVEIKGEKPTSGIITLKNGKIKDVEMVLSEKTITKEEDELVYKEPVSIAFELDADFVYSEKHEESKALLNLSDLSFDNVESLYEYDLLIDDEFVTKVYALIANNDMVAIGSNNSDIDISLFGYDSILEIIYSDFKIEGKHNIKITNKQKAANDTLLFVGDDGTIVLEGEKFVAGSANILITDEDNVKYLEEKVELVSWGIPDFYGADSQCRETLFDNINLFNAMDNGKKIKVEVSQMVNGKEITSKIYDSAKVTEDYGGYYIGQFTLIGSFGGC